MATATRTVNYLLVEDNDEHADIIARSLRYEKLASEVRRVKTGSECLAYLAGDGPLADRDRYPYPDIVLLDIRMPGILDGFQTLKAIRADAKHASLVVMILTTSDREDDTSQAYKLGANGYIVKSENTGEMIDKLLSLHHSFETWAHLPAQKPEPAGERQRGAAGSAPRAREEASLLDDSQEDAYALFEETYRRDRNEALQLLKDAERSNSTRFTALAQTFCAEQRHLLAGGENVDWMFLREVVMDRLPRRLGFAKMAGLVINITAVLDANRAARRDSASWQVWQGFCRAYLNQDVNLPSEVEEEPPAALAGPAGRWRVIAIVAITLFSALLLAVLAREFL